MSEILTAGKDDFDVLIVADGHPPGGTHIMKDREQSLLVKQLRMAGITASRCHIITPCPAVPQEISKSAKRSAEWIMERHDMFWEEFTPLLETAKVVLILGKTAAHQVMGKSVPVTKNRGVFMDIPKIPCKSLITLSPTHVLVRPEVLPDFETDIGKLGRFVSAGFVDEATDIEEGDYRIVTDLSFLLDKPPTALALDTETSGLDWAGDARVLMAQISVREGESFIIPFSPERFPDIPRNDIMRGINHLRTLLAKPSVRVFGHNLKFDLHMLRKHRIRVANWWMETMQLAFAMDENMQSKNLDECVRRWVPEMAGYADCVVPETEILTYDMRKVKAGSLKVGDKLCAFTAETNGKKACRRKMAVSTVLGVQKLTRPCLKITTESGRSIIVSRGHLFLCKHGLSDKGGGWRWRRADGLTVGSVLKPFPWEDHETDFDAGYVSGIFDGEGWLHSGRSRIGVAQKPGVVLDNFKRILLGNSIFWGHSTDKRKDVPVVNVTFDGHDCFKILQKFRPLRLLENCSWEGCGLPTNGHKHDRIVSIVDAGSREVVGLKTSTQTIIAEGLLSHNSFNAEVDKSKMAEVDLSKLIKYAGGDTDATFRLCKRLVSEVKQDKPQWRTVVKVQMPVLRMFFEMEERGICIDSNKLSSFGKELSDREEILYKELVDLVPRKVRQKHFSKGLSFSRADLIIDILFSEDGYGLCPKMFTKGSTEGSMKPSTDSKHLSNFPNNPFVQKFSEYQKIQKMRSTYVGERGGLAAKEISLLKSGKFPAKFARIVEEEPEELKHASNVDRVEVRMPDGKTIRLGLKTEIDPEAGGLAFHKGKWYAVKHVRDTGFWKHIMPDGKIHPSFLLHGTVTGRSSSRDPNSQNIPKRGPLAKPYRRMFVPTPGYVFLEADESQAELRVAAWMANDPTMIKIYREGGDIHRTTAARTARIKPEEVTSDMRQKAKAINFGFLYRMSANSFVDYAKYQYGVTFTLAEAKRVKADYFSLYSRLPDWHKRMSDLAHRDGFVRALHGAIRHLPSINSNEAMVVAEAERQAINSPIQRMASDISLLGLSQFAKGCDHKLMRPVAFIHDAGVVEVREDMALQGAAWLKWCMENPPLEELFGLRCPIPLVSDVTMGDNLGDMAEIKVTAEKPPWIV